MKKVGTFTGLDGSKLNVCLPLEYAWTCGDDELTRMYCRGINLLASDGVSILDQELIKVGISTNYGGIESVEFEDKFTPAGYRPTYTLDKKFQVIEKTALKNGVALVNNSDLQDFDTKAEALQALLLLSNARVEAPISGSIKIAEVGESFFVNEKAVIYMPTYSAHSKGPEGCLVSSPLKYTLSKEGKEVLTIDNDGSIPFGNVCNNNHPTEGCIPVSFGQYALDIENKGRDSVVAGFLRVNENNSPYAIYYPNDSLNPAVGLDRATIYKEVTPGAKIKIPYSVLNDVVYDSYGDHVQIMASLIIDGKIYTGQYEISYDWGNTWGTYYGMYASIDWEGRYFLRAKHKPECSVHFIVDAFNRTVKLVSSTGGASISEEHFFISVRRPYINGTLSPGYPYFKHETKCFNNKGEVAPDNSRIIKQDWNDIR